MNFLAHIYLSGNREQVMVGNFIGDFVKGKSFEKYHPELQKGILLHREIDRYTDIHPVVMTSKERLRPKYRHYAPVIIDIFYDHFLASEWNNYHPVELKSYTLQFYKKMSRYLHVIPSRAAFMFSHMRKDNWLYLYKYINGIQRSLKGMSQRTTFESGMEYAHKDLEKDYLAYQNEFRTFFPDLIKHAYSYLDSIKIL